MITQKEAKRKICAEYARWLREEWEPENKGKILTEYQRKTESRAFKFYGLLNGEHPEWLLFRFVGSDVWQVVKIWIIEYEREHGIEY